MKKDFETFMAKLHHAQETPLEERTKEQQDLINMVKNMPSYNELFKKKRKQ